MTNLPRIVNQTMKFFAKNKIGKIATQENHFPSRKTQKKTNLCFSSHLPRNFIETYGHQSPQILGEFNMIKDKLMATKISQQRLKHH